MVKNDGKETEFQVKEESEVTLQCSIDILNTTGIKMDFAFRSSSGRPSSKYNYNKTMSCDETDQLQDGNWEIKRKGNIICYLKINFNSADNGQYICYIYVPNDNTPYYNDWSKSIILHSAENQNNPLTLQLMATVIFVVLICFIVLSVLGFVLLSPSVHVLKRFRRRVPDPGAGILYYLIYLVMHSIICCLCVTVIIDEVAAERIPILGNNNAVTAYSNGAGSNVVANNLKRPCK